jgi:hypothetical protein
MATTYNRRCGLCGQYVASEDREALLEEHRLEWSESVVDDFIAGSRHDCVDTDPHGARASARLIEAGLIAPELRWLLEAALERRQADGRPAWAVFTTSSTMAPGVRPALAVRRPASGSLRPMQGPARVRLPVDGMGRSPPPVRASRSKPIVPTALEGATMPATIARLSTVRSTAALVHATDPTLIADVVTLRRELEAAVERIIPLLVKVDPIQDRTVDVVEVLEQSSEGMDAWSEVSSLAGIDGLDRVVQRLMAAMPRSVEPAASERVKVARVA